MTVKTVRSFEDEVRDTDREDVVLKWSGFFTKLLELERIFQNEDFDAPAHDERVGER